MTNKQKKEANFPFLIQTSSGDVSWMMNDADAASASLMNLHCAFILSSISHDTLHSSSEHMVVTTRQLP